MFFETQKQQQSRGFGGYKIFFGLFTVKVSQKLLVLKHQDPNGRIERGKELLTIS